ncbi:hypothetical protein NZ698_13235 [Chryseobacterium sp. PBS4-4]|uniref:DUF402 domain-containing protein n=1 Tax=Chryseobacterium edaphi TaxID=2976532 RepID=A0ABT2W7J5_9FLAO|nr:hypothetical protein [Chryseobacterium edaphi]MCU7618166.1 hypothetical protein [Chryseobacterium edaphi]
MEILNKLVYLKKVELLPTNGLLLKFDNLPIWRNNSLNIYFTDRDHDYYEGIFIYFKENILNYHLLFKSLIGEQLYIEISNKYLNVWYAEYFDHIEDRNTVDNLEEIEILDFKVEKIEKTKADWKCEYKSLEKTYLDLLYINNLEH